MQYRIEKDTMGEIRVPSHRLWGAQTQRSLENFRIGTEKMPWEVVRSLVVIKKAAAIFHHRLGKMDDDFKDAIVQACDEILMGRFADEFPLLVWQTGSGTQTNMNVNEVVAHRANQILQDMRSQALSSGKLLDSDDSLNKRLHPNDHVNMSQSTNDAFPTAMHIAAVTEIEDRLFPSLNALRESLRKKSDKFQKIVKIGRTHLQDATPLTLGQELSGYVAMLDNSAAQFKDCLIHLRELAIGGTAVGTGLNAPPRFGEEMALLITEITGKKFVSSPNKFHALTSHDTIVFTCGALQALAANLMKIANDVRWMASGPRCGIGEISIPENEPGSSIMPGKVNPTQCEALTMVVCQVFGNTAAITFAASQGNFELNVFKPVVIYDLLQAIRLLSDSMASFCDHCIEGMEPVTEKIDEHLQKSLMLVTALSPYIGYENAARIAKLAHEQKLTLKEATVRLGLLTSEQFDQYVRPERMV